MMLLVLWYFIANYNNRKKRRLTDSSSVYIRISLVLYRARQKSNP